MKRRSAMGLALALALLFAGCSQEVQPGSTAPSEVPGASSVSEPESVPQTPDQPASSQTEPEPSAEPNQPVEVVYKEDEFLTWVPNAPETESQPIQAGLHRIHSMRYGEAGASLDMTSAAAYMLKNLEEEPDFEAQLETYLKLLTPLQRDYFSFQWQNVHAMAVRMLEDPANYQPMLGDVGREDLDLASCDAGKLKEMDDLVHAKLASYGVCDSWKNYPDIEPFCLQGEA